MANNDPTSRRMLFGRKQAYSPGVNGFRKQLAPELYDFATKERAAEKEVAALAKQHPSLKERFAEIAREQIANPVGHRVQDILLLLKREVRMAERLAKREALKAKLRKMREKKRGASIAG